MVDTRHYCTDTCSVQEPVGAKTTSRSLHISESRSDDAQLSGSSMTRTHSLQQERGR
ncbi:hypothetical protein AG1IA_00052 [Rhizoctonia solani AG-1 IA]|uniref:Uncharacterized protein n=1 Tax=Thanatephorus cucumeris (strain AG1-IA) TaxID=983506 RepID=L8X6T1_THACA|nr:hypothetical protein AG1IA_00052 [Rhizoctonia solani AG-1 IA]